MMTLERAVAVILAGFASVWAAVASAQTDSSVLPPPPDRQVDYSREIEPILRTRCMSCHGPQTQESGLRFDNRRAALRGANSGKVGEVQAFVSDESPQAVEQLVERLLSSPHYGERWGRHWLDLVRYGDWSLKRLHVLIMTSSSYRMSRQ